MLIFNVELQVRASIHQMTTTQISTQDARRKQTNPKRCANWPIQMKIALVLIMKLAAVTNPDRAVALDLDLDPIRISIVCMINAILRLYF